MKSFEEAQAFTLLDQYARSKHRCFVAEMFLSDAKTEYVLCFRPAEIRKESPDRFACKYLRIPLEDVRALSVADTLPVRLRDELDIELLALGIK
jgi:hypothetical protein